MSKAVIKKICLEVNSKKIELSLSEAKELMQVLKDLFNDTPQISLKDLVRPKVIEKHYPPIIIHDPPYRPYRPYDIWYQKYDHVTCGKSSETLMLSNNTSGRTQ
jgi:hypothetical protein